MALEMAARARLGAAVALESSSLPRSRKRFRNSCSSLPWSRNGVQKNRSQLLFGKAVSVRLFSESLLLCSALLRASPLEPGPDNGCSSLPLSRIGLEMASRARLGAAAYSKSVTRVCPGDAEYLMGASRVCPGAAECLTGGARATAEAQDAPVVPLEPALEPQHARKVPLEPTAVRCVRFGRSKNAASCSSVIASTFARLHLASCMFCTGSH